MNKNHTDLFYSMHSYSTHSRNRWFLGIISIKLKINHTDPKKTFTNVGVWSNQWKWWIQTLTLFPGCASMPGRLCTKIWISEIFVNLSLIIPFWKIQTYWSKMVKKFSKSDYFRPIYGRLKLSRCADRVFRYHLAMSGDASAANCATIFWPIRFTFVRWLYVPAPYHVLKWDFQGVGHVDPSPPSPVTSSSKKPSVN